MIITWKPIGSKKPAIEYRQPRKDVLRVGDNKELDFSWIDNDGVFTIPTLFANFIHKAERIDGIIHLSLLYRCDGHIKEPSPIDYGEEEVLEWKR